MLKPTTGLINFLIIYMANYPSGVYDPRTKENDPEVEYDAEQSTIVFAEDVSKLDDEVVAIETELGASPKGDHSDVKTRIENAELSAIVFVVDGGGSAIEAGLKGFLEIPFKCEIQQVTLLADQSGSAKVDIWKDTYANFPPTDADTITASNEPEISSGVKDQDSTLTSWTKTITAGDVLAFNVDSASTIEKLTIVLKIKKIA
jgi:hypothetical protein